MRKLEELRQFGQSAWLDNINRSLLKTGKLRELIAEGLCGLTSNPTIFDNAISKSDDYDDVIGDRATHGASTFEIYDQLTIRDIQEAADLFRPVYERTGGIDGYVSLEINPTLAHDLSSTVKEGRRLHEKVQRPNLMLKVPATEEGYRAIEEFVALGFNINATLIFSLEQYEKTAGAYISGLGRLVSGGGNPEKVHSVASIFVSRIDTAVDTLLQESIQQESGSEAKDTLEALKGQAAVANSLLIYRKHREIFSSPEFLKLKEKGCNYQRVLWASTGTKNPHYSDIKYVTDLLVKNTVNTMPEGTLKAFIDHGVIRDVSSRIDSALPLVEKLGAHGISVAQVCQKLLNDGVKAFEKSFESLLGSIESKAKKLTMKG